MKTIKALGFNGMANIKLSPASLMDDNRRITPRFVLNARVLDDGRVVRRGAPQGGGFAWSPFPMGRQHYAGGGPGSR